MYLIPTYIRREDTVIKGLHFASIHRLFPPTHHYMRDELDVILIEPKMGIVPVMENEADITKWLSL